MNSSRRTMQSHECIRGFVYHDDFNQLYDWSEAEIDPLQVSNIPLLQRAETDSCQGNRSKIMLIHDYEGGYLDYEACQGMEIEVEKYSCEYLQCVETFVYFSHKLVTVPPPTWTNTCHRNGVQVLGTFIVEPDTLQVERILEQHDGVFWVARQLANIAEAYKFDGWLINIEKPFPALYWSMSGLETFLRQLRSLLGPSRKVVWYDALIPMNVIWYQNTLNYLNLPFALAAGAILTNYAWNPALATQAKLIAERSGLGTANLYLGIDAWAQNTHDGKNPRVTYPPKTGGGTGIGLGIMELASLRANVGVFAPGWSFEHFNEHNREMEEAVWLGKKLDEDLNCDCTPNGLHLTVPYREHPIVKYAMSYPSGSSSFFHTNFEKSFTRSRLNVGSKLFAHLGRQSVMPTSRRADFISAASTGPENSCAYLYADLEGGLSGCSFSVRLRENVPESQEARARARLRIFNIMMSDERPLDLMLTYQKAKTPGVTIQMKLNDSDEGVKFSETPRKSTKIKKRYLNTSTQPLRSVELVFDGAYSEIRNLGSDFLCLTELTIQPGLAPAHDIKIRNIHIKCHERCGTVHHRLVWELSKFSDVASSGSPFSDVTGPFDHFVVRINDEDIGMAYALEYEITSDGAASTEPGEEVVINLTGVGFDGSKRSSAVKTLIWPSVEEDDGWIIV